MKANAKVRSAGQPTGGLPRKTIIAVSVCALLGGAAPAWAVCTATPSGVTVDNALSSGVLAPASNETVTCTGTNFTSIENTAATNVTVNVSGGLISGNIAPPAIDLGAGARISVGAGSTVLAAGNGAIIIRGEGNTVTNDGRIVSNNNEAIQGNLFGAEARNATIINNGLIQTTSTRDATVRTGTGATVTNSGTIELFGDDSDAALVAGTGSTVTNTASGTIRATELNAATRRVNAVALSNSSLTNLGKIEVIGNINGAARGSAISVFNPGGGAITNSGTIDASKGAQAISGSGKTTIDNSGTIIGGTVAAIDLVSGEGSEVIFRTGSQVTGTVKVRGANALANAKLTLDGTGTHNDVVTGFNSMEKRGTGTWTLGSNLQAGSTDARQGDVRGPMLVNVVDAGGRLDLTGALSNAADGKAFDLSKEGAGTLRLSGNSTATGTLLVQAGTLDVAGAVPMATTVGTLGTVVGTGTLGRLTSLGRVAPGNSVGTLNVTGNYFQDTTGTLDIEIKPDGSGNDLLAVGGATVLSGTLKAGGENGALLTPAAGGTQGSPKLYTILTSGSGVLDRFTTTPAPLGAYVFNTIYNPNNVQLGVTYAGFTAVQTPGVIPGTGTTNQVTKAVALDRVPVVTTPPTTGQSATGYNSGNADFDRVLSEMANETADQLASTFNAIIAEPYAAFNTVLLEQNDLFAETVLGRAQACSIKGFGSLSGDFSLQQATPGAGNMAGCATAAGARRQGLWVDASYNKGKVDGENGLSGYDTRLWGMVLGADTALAPNVAVGVAAGFGQPKLDNYELASARIEGDSYFLSAYGTLTHERWEFAGLLGYTFGSYDAERQINFGSINRTAKADFDGDGFIASLKAAYFYKIDDIDLIPEVGLTYSKIWQDGLTETGADSLNLRVEDAEAHSVITSLGVRVAKQFQIDSVRIRPQALVRYDYDWNAGDDNAHTVTSSFATVPVVGSMEMIGQNRGEHNVTLGAGATVQVAANADLYAGGAYRWNSNGDEYSLGAGARVMW